MDLSKLNRMSQTPPKPPVPQGQPDSASPLPHPPYAAEPSTYYAPPAPAIGGQVWLSGILGIVFILLGLRFAKWLITTLTGGTFVTGAIWGRGGVNDPAEGTPVGYWQLRSFANLTGPDIAWSEAAIFLFGLALILEAVSLIASVKAGPGVRKAFLALAIGVTALATIFNIGVVIYLISIGITLPLMSLLAAAFGGYMLSYLWQEWKMLGPWPGERDVLVQS